MEKLTVEQCDSPKQSKKVNNNQAFISPMPSKYQKGYYESSRIEFLSASANRKEAVESLSAQNLVQPIGHQPRLFANVLTPNKFKVTSKKMFQSQNVGPSKKSQQPEICSPSQFEETSTTQFNCGDSMHEPSPHLKVPDEPYGELNTFSVGNAHSTASASAFGDQDSENLVTKFKQIQISPESGISP